MASCYTTACSVPSSSSLSTVFIILSLLLSAHHLIIPCKGARILAAAQQAASPTITYDQFIKTSCGTTTYPLLCFSSLSSYSDAIRTSPMQLATSALTVSFNSARSTSTAMKLLSKSGRMSPRVAGAMSDCVEIVGDSVDELKQSLEAIGDLSKGKDFRFQLSNIQTWVSGALTDDDTCMDGFAGKGMDGYVKSAVRKYVLNVAQLTSNALALINQLAPSQSSTHP